MYMVGQPTKIALLCINIFGECFSIAQYSEDSGFALSVVSSSIVVSSSEVVPMILLLRILAATRGKVEAEPCVDLKLIADVCVPI